MLTPAAIMAQPTVALTATAAHPSFEGIWEPKFDPAAMRTTGTLSLLFWIAVVTFGRWIGCTIDGNC